MIFLTQHVALAGARQPHLSCTWGDTTQVTWCSSSSLLTQTQLTSSNDARQNNVATTVWAWLHLIPPILLYDWVMKVAIVTVRRQRRPPTSWPHKLRRQSTTKHLFHSKMLSTVYLMTKYVIILYLVPHIMLFISWSYHHMHKNDVKIFIWRY